MSEIENEDVLEVPNELQSLKARADLLGISYHPSIGVEKLREKVNAAVDTPAEEVALPVSTEETEQEFRLRKRNEANALVRVRVTCMNPSKREWDGEIFTCGNSNIGTFRKYVPFNAEDGWHIPRVIFNHLQERMCQVFTTVRDSRGNSTRQGKLIKEFAIEVLPQLTAEELHDLAQRQAMAKSID